MKFYHFIFLISILNPVFAQQKINVTKYPNGTETFELITKFDSTFIVNYANGNRESTCKLKANTMDGLYKRWYENGNKMWEKEMHNNKANGTSKYYNIRGELIAQFNYNNDTITDTIFLKKNVHFILGKILFSSVVYGGAEYADGRSNVSENSGPFAYFTMNTAQLDTLKPPKLIGSFKSDGQGNFLCIVSKGKIGLYPTAIKIETLKAPFTGIPSTPSMSGNESWDLSLPISINQAETFKILVIKHTSVGYAP
jgi:hypothetical protein